MGSSSVAEKSGQSNAAVCRALSDAKEAIQRAVLQADGEAPAEVGTAFRAVDRALSAVRKGTEDAARRVKEAQQAIRAAVEACEDGRADPAEEWVRE